MQNANQDPNRPRQPNVLPFSASWRCYPGNLGSMTLGTDTDELVMAPGKLILVTGKLYKLVVKNFSFATH